MALTSPLVTELPSADCARPIAVMAHLRAQGTPGSALLESAGAGPELGAIRRTILLMRAWLRLELRAGGATATALGPAGEPTLGSMIASA